VNLQLVLATDENISSIQSMAEVIWRDHYPEIIGMEQVNYMLARFYSTEAMLQQMVEGQRFYRVMVDGEPQGFVAIEQRGEGDYFLNKLYIDTRQQRSGMGQAIWQELMIMITDLRTMRLQVNRQNYKAINFYFKVGFVIERVADFDIGDGYFMNDFVMIYQSACH
jgi:ribosomal protein S18 acetylase RimI-like enzyme